MPRVVETTVYKFDELSDRAKEKAREWFLQEYPDHEWWDTTYEDAKLCLGFLGFSVDKIYFSGFWSQGDGACFTGSWSVDRVKVADLKEHAPKDEELHRLAEIASKYANDYVLDAQLADDPYAMTIAGGQSRYNHENSVDIEVHGDHGSTAEEELCEMARDCMRWIYNQLKAEYEWLTSDEQVDESMRINEYEFDEEGNRAW
jgi:hypothetical protein